MALLLLSQPVAADERDELDKTRRRLGQVEAVLGDARADAGAVAAPAAGVVAGRAGWPPPPAGSARRPGRRPGLAATDEVGRQEARLAWQVRRAYMTGEVTGSPWSCRPTTYAT